MRQLLLRIASRAVGRLIREPITKLLLYPPDLGQTRARLHVSWNKHVRTALHYTRLRDHGHFWGDLLLPIIGSMGQGYFTPQKGRRAGPWYDLTSKTR